MSSVTRKPEYLVVFSFTPREGLLEVWGESLGKSVVTLYKIFAQTLLDLGEIATGKPRKQLRSSKVMTQRLQFNLIRARNLRSLVLTEIQLVNIEDSRRYISIKSNRDESALYEEFDKRVPREIRGLYVVDAPDFDTRFIKRNLREPRLHRGSQTFIKLRLCS